MVRSVHFGRHRNRCHRSELCVYDKLDAASAGDFFAEVFCLSNQRKQAGHEADFENAGIGVGGGRLAFFLGSPRWEHIWAVDRRMLVSKFASTWASQSGKQDGRRGAMRRLVSKFASTWASQSGKQDGRRGVMRRLVSKFASTSASQSGKQDGRGRRRCL